MIFYRGCCVGLTLLNVKDTAFHPIRSFRRVSVKCHEFDTRRRYPMQQPLLICSFFQIYRLLTYLDIHYSIFLYFSSNGCWIKSWATFQNPNPAATRYLNTSAAPFWVRKTFLFHLLKIFFSHITSIFLPCRYFSDQNEAHFYLKSKTLPKSTIWRSKQVPVFIFFDKVQYLSISNSSA